MRYGAAILAFLVLAAAAAPAAAGPHGHDGNGHGGHGQHGDGDRERGHGPDGRGHGGHGGVIDGPRGPIQSLGHILGGIRRHHPGRLSDVRGPMAGPGGEPHYRVKWLTPEGRVLWLDVDASTGEVLDIEGGADGRGHNRRGD